MRSKYTCNDCLWNDKCRSDYPCDDIVLFDEDDKTEEYIEQKRLAFYKEWNKYIDDCSEEDIFLDYHYNYTVR